MLNKITNKISVIVLALLVFAFVSFSYLTYSSSKDNTIELLKAGKQSATVALDVFMTELLSTKTVAIDGIQRFMESHPEILRNRDMFEEDLIELGMAIDADEIYMGFEDNGDMIGIEMIPSKSVKPYRVSADSKFDVRKREWYQLAMQKPGSIVYSTPYITSSGKHSFSIAKTIQMNNKIVGVLGVDIYMNKLDEAFARMKDSPNSLAVIASREHQTLIHHPDSKKIMSQEKEIKDVVKYFFELYDKDPTHGFFYSYKGEEKVGACELHHQSGWLVCSVASMSDYTPMLNEALMKQIIISVLFIVAIVVILVLAISHFLKPLASISDGLKSFFSFLNYEIKKPISINVNTKDEFGVMGNLINENIKKIQNTAAQDAKAVNQAVSTAKMIEDGNLKARITDDPANPQLVELKNVLNKMLDTLELKVGSDLNVIKATFDSFRRQDFTSSVPNAKGEVEVVTNALGVEIAKMLQTNLDQAEILQQKAQ
ncbi:MAG: PDC sensor domain-containing protein, partial [Campylobacter sp.]